MSLYDLVNVSIRYGGIRVEEAVSLYDLVNVSIRYGGIRVEEDGVSGSEPV